MHSNRSRGTLMSYTDHSAQRHFKLNTPIDFSYKWLFFFSVNSLKIVQIQKVCLVLNMLKMADRLSIH